MAGIEDDLSRRDLARDGSGRSGDGVLLRLSSPGGSSRSVEPSDLDDDESIMKAVLAATFSDEEVLLASEPALGLPGARA